MKIVFTVDSMNSGGAERVVSNLANEFTKRGNQVFVVMISTNKCESFYHLNDGVQLSCVLPPTNKKIRFFRRTSLIKKHICNIKPDIVISFLSHVNIYSFISLRGTSIPIVVSERCDPNQYSFFIRLLLKVVFKKSNGCIFQTNDAMKWYGKQVFKKSIVIPNPVSLNISEDQIQRKPTKEKTIISVGRLVDQKNFSLLIEAFANFYKMHNDYVLKIYGEGPLKDKLCHQIAEHNLENAVSLMGNSKTWQFEERDSSLFVLSSDYEGMPNALMEAMALQIPCVSTNCPIGGPGELIKDNVNGYLAPVNNALALSEIINKAIDRPLIDEHFLQKYSIEMISNMWEEYLDKVINSYKH